MRKSLTLSTLIFLSIRTLKADENNCSPGHYYNPNYSSCQYCPVGTYSDSTGATSCTPCPAGFITGDSGSTSCSPCRPGSYQVRANWCEWCPTGTYSDTSGATSCTPCPAGFITENSGATSCSPCRPGTYQVRVNWCEWCPMGTYSDTTAATKCTSCPDGYIASNSGSTSCSACRAGTYRQGINWCEWCPTGTHSLRASNQCTPDFYPSSDTTPVKESLLKTTIHDTLSFLEGTFYSLVLEDKIGEIEKIEEVPKDLKNAWNSWAEVKWTDGSSIKAALVSTATAVSDVWDVAQMVIPDEAKATCLTFVTEVAPEIVIIYEAGTFAYHLAENAKDITENVQELFEGFKESDFNKAGKAFGHLIKDATELRGSIETIKNGGSKEVELFLM